MRQLVVCLFIAAALVAASAPGDFVLYDGINYSFHMSHVPDFDQRRAAGSGIVGLPADGGMYCVPTSAVNWMAYLANHGFPAFDPGAGNWEVSPPANTAAYNHVTG